MVIYEAAADLPLEELGGRTPLQVARCPNAARLAEAGCSGFAAPLREGLDGRNEVTLAAMLGADPDEAMELHRGPVEAAGTGFEDASGYDYAYCGNFVTIDNETLTDGKVTTLSLQETRTLAACLQKAWKPGEALFAAVKPARLVMLCRTGGAAMSPGQPPCYCEGESITRVLPKGRRGEFLKAMLDKSNDVLQKQTLNDVRLDLGENPANAVWLWGGGPVQSPLKLFGDRDVSGVVLAGSALTRGLARLGGMAVVEMNRSGKANNRITFDRDALSAALDDHDFVLVYVETPRKLGQYGSAVDKVRALEALDKTLLGPLVEVLGSKGAYRLLLTSDGVVSTQTQRPTSGTNPIVLVGDGVDADRSRRWDEEEAARGALKRVKVTRLFELLMEGD